MPPDKNSRDIEFLDKYALERWEVCHSILSNKGFELKGNGYTFKGNKFDIAIFIFLYIGATLKGKNLLPLGIAPIFERFQILWR